jgi:Flp pilus assembly CpaF family ATPase
LRLTALFPPVTDQISVVVQKFGPSRKSFTELVADQGASREMQQVLEACAGNNRNILVVGDHHATLTVVQSLAASLPPRFRVISAVDGLGAPSGIPAWTKLSTAAGLPDLVAIAASLRPDYLLVEVRSAAIAADVVYQSVMGHQGGTIASLAGRSADDGLARLRALAGSSASERVALSELIASGFDVIVFASTLPTGAVRIFEVGEPKVDRNGNLIAEPLLHWKADGSGTAGKFVATGTSSRLAATLAAQGRQLPASVLRK